MSDQLVRDITISVANPTDIASVADMQSKLWHLDGCPSNDPFANPDTVYDLLSGLLQYQDRGCILVARTAQRRVVGCIIGAVEMTEHGPEGDAGGLFVERGMPRNTAIELVKAVSYWYKQMGISVVRVTISQEGKRGDRARKFHEHIGFKPEAIILRANTEDVIKSLEDNYGRYR